MSQNTSSLKQKAINGILWGGLSNFTQQILSLIIGILLSRTLSSKDYGIVSLLFIFSQMASSIQESGFITALANKKEVTNKDYNAVFWMGILISVCLYFILFFSAPYIANFYNAPELTTLARFVFIGLLIGSTGIAHSAYLFKQLKVKERTLSMTMAVAISGIIALILAKLGYDYWSLAAQSVSYISIYTLMLWYYSRFQPSLKINLSPIKSLYKFSGKVLISNIFQIINSNVYSIFIGRFYPKESLGYFSQAAKWSTMAQSVIVAMNTNFAQPMLASIEDDRTRQSRVFRKLVSFTAFASFPLMFGLSLISREFILITITEKWLQSVPLLQILACGAALFPLVHIFQSYILSYGRSDIYLKNIVTTGLLQLVLFSLVYNYGLIAIAFSVVATQVLAFILWQVSVCKLQMTSFFGQSKDCLLYLIIAAISYLIAHYVGSFFPNIYSSAITKLATLTGVYLSILYLYKDAVLLEIFNIAKKKMTKLQS